MLSSPSWIVFFLTIFLSILYTMVSRRRKALEDPYGSFHLSLNVQSTVGESGEVQGTKNSDGPSTEWLNMGYWKDTENFPEACEALALKLIEAAGCVPGGRVLDVGHGSGDSLLLHLENSRVLRPSKLVGITSLASHHQRASERVHESQTRSSAARNVEVDLYLGDAVYRSSTPSNHSAIQHHPLSPNGGEFSSILALDCAYHFDTRQVFLRQCFTHLSPGGKIALADICFQNGRPPTPLLRRLLGTVGVMPSSNAVTEQEYLRIMSNIGYEGVILEDISTHVFPGFIQFLRTRGMAWRLFTGVFKILLVKNGARFVIVAARKPNASAKRDIPSL